MKILRNHYASMQIPPDLVVLESALQFIYKLSDILGMQGQSRDQLILAAKQSILLVIKNNEATPSQESIQICVWEEARSIFVEVINHGVPLYLKGQDVEVAKFHQLGRGLDKVVIENRGRSGQSIILSMRLGEGVLENQNEIAPILPEGKISVDAGMTVRELGPNEEHHLSQLFYYVYGYQYIHDFVYYPEKIRKLIDEKKLISIVGVAGDGQIIGHVGLLKWGEAPSVYEPCLGVVDPRLKSRGLFRTIFQKTMERVKEIPMQYLFFDFVTNHDYSQRFVSTYGICDMALFVGCQSKETQARLERIGLGKDSKEMDRYTLLYGVIPQVKYPFGREILLPNNLGEMFGFLLKPLNLNWSPAPRFQLLRSGGEYETKIQPAQNAVVFDLHMPGRAAVKRLLTEWRELLRSGYQYCGVEMPVDAPGLGNLYDILSEEGFFVAGFVPYHNSGRLAFRFQSIGPTKVAFDDIKVYTDNAKELLRIVRSNYERNGLL